MKKLLFCLLCFSLLTFGSSAKIIEVAPAGAWGTMIISGSGGAAAAGQTFENLTTYTETDDTANRFAQDSNTCTATNLTRVDTGYVYKDHGAGAFGTTFTQWVDFYQTDTEGTATAMFWGISDTPGTFADMSSGWTGIIYAGTIGVAGLNGGAQDYTSAISNSTTYYILITRSGGTVTMKIYTTKYDRDNDTDSNLFDTISSVEATQAATTYQYLLPCFARDATGTSFHNWYSENFCVSPPCE